MPSPLTAIGNASMEKHEHWAVALPLVGDLEAADLDLVHRHLRADAILLHVPEVRANGVSLYYEEHGTGAPILCIHGTSASAAVWADAAAELANRGRTIIYDRRGCFRSERPEPYATNVHEQADDAAALIDALAAAPAVVVGRSYGGETAIDLALRYPDRVRALVLLEASLLSLSDAAVRWAESVKQEVFADADVDMSRVAETFCGGSWATRPGRDSPSRRSGCSPPTGRRSSLNSAAAPASSRSAWSVSARSCSRR